MRLHPAFKIVFKPRPPYDFARTVHKPAGWSLFTPFEVWEDGVLWTSAILGGRLSGSGWTRREPWAGRDSG